eukprot:8356586-Pyramimonas_sp.AAC.1
MSARPLLAFHQRSHGYQSPCVCRSTVARLSMEWDGRPPADSTSPRNVLAPDVTQLHRSGATGCPAATAHIH